jgi:hypothetical protein
MSSLQKDPKISSASSLISGKTEGYDYCIPTEVFLFLNIFLTFFEAPFVTFLEDDIKKCLSFEDI